MHAIHVLSDQPRPEGSRPLVWQPAPDPIIGPDEVLVDIHATALNRADLSQRAGNYPPPPGAPDILGLEMAGVIRDVGPRVKAWQPGDAVCALLGGGGYAEQVAVHHAMLMPVPTGWSFEQAACLPEVYLTAYVNLFLEAGLRPGETVLVHGGASGVGTAAVQLLHSLGHRVFVTVGTAEKAATCLRLGADLAVNYREADFVQAVRDFTGGDGVDVILDMVGGDYYPRNVDLLNLRGRLVFIATLGGSRVEIEIGALMRKRARLIGSVLRTRSLDEKVDIREKFMGRFWPQIEAGEIKPVIDRVYPIAETEVAHARMAANENIGKIVLKVR